LFGTAESAYRSRPDILSVGIDVCQVPKADIPRSPLSRHIELKFQTLFAEIADGDIWPGYRAMLESIRADVLDM
jgi:hypothetical protein